MNHDALFKELLQSFFPEFLRLFFPDEAALLRLSDDADSVRFLNQEAFTDFPDGTVRRADVVAEVRTTGGGTELVLVHLEIQAERARDVPFRMWEYYYLLRSRFRRPVFPVVLYLSPGAGGLTVERYNEGILGRQFLAFEYAVVGLPDLAAEDYETIASPLATALASLMRSEETDQAGRKYRSLLRVTGGSGLDEARQLLLATVVQRYLRLTPADEETVEQRLAQEQEGAGAMSIYTLLREEFVQEGIEQGIEQGTLRAQRETLRRLLQAKFGVLPDLIVARIETLDSSFELETLLLRVLTAQTLAEMAIDDTPQSR
ncbi:MAG: hypothetical protein H7Z41_10360 [Cytophagales bacterium]|nr:hypothetical protein [Armatimonadota bacterium]